MAKGTHNNPKKKLKESDSKKANQKKGRKLKKKLQEIFNK